MNDKFWKRELALNYIKSHDNWNHKGVTPLPFHSLKSMEMTKNGHVDIHQEKDAGNIPQKDYYFAGMALGIGAFVLTLLVIGVFFFKKKRANKQDSEYHNIMVYPSNMGKGPTFMTKQINFSLPTVKSSSMVNLDLGESNFAGDIESDTLLQTTSNTNRSNSFSCYGLGVIEPSLYKSSPDLDEILWPPGHIGRIWFSLRYEPSTEKLLVSLLKAKNLPSRSYGTVNSCDPMVRLHLMPDERRYLQSKQKKKTCNPYFDETLVFQVSAKDMSDHILKLTVIDVGRHKGHAVIGHITFALRDLDIGDGSEQQLFKLDLEKEPQELKSDLGEILISLVYNENLNRLTVTVIDAKRLKFQTEKHEAYVRVSLNQQHKIIKEKRTHVSKVSSTNEGDILSFSEGFHFKLLPNQVDVSSLTVCVFQAALGYDKLIGKCVLGSYMFARGKALVQWNTAFANAMEQVQQWHLLND